MTQGIETIKFGEFFAIIFAGNEISIVPVRTNKANAPEIIEFSVKIYDENEEKELTLDDDTFQDPEWTLEVRAKVKESTLTGLIGLGEYKKVIGEAQKLIDFMYENRDNFLEKLGLK